MPILHKFCIQLNKIKRFNFHLISISIRLFVKQNEKQKNKTLTGALHDCVQNRSNFQFKFLLLLLAVNSCILYSLSIFIYLLCYRYNGKQIVVENLHLPHFDVIRKFFCFFHSLSFARNFFFFLLFCSWCVFFALCVYILSNLIERTLITMCYFSLSIQCNVIQFISLAICGWADANRKTFTYIYDFQNTYKYSKQTNKLH